MKSIVQGDREGCFICQTTNNLEEHHIFGGSNRALSDKYHLVVHLCSFHHRDSKNGAHFNPELMAMLKEKGRTAFEREYPDLDFEEIFIRGLDR